MASSLLPDVLIGLGLVALYAGSVAVRRPEEALDWQIQYDADTMEMPDWLGTVVVVLGVSFVLVGIVFLAFGASLILA